MKSVFSSFYGSLCLTACMVFLGFLLGGPPLAAETDEELILRYEAVWKSVFLKQNGFSDEEFRQNISVKEKNIMHSENQKYLCMKYVQKIDWLEISCYDQVMIFMSSKEDAYRHIPLPRDTFFSEADVTLAVQKGVDASSLTRVRKAGPLAYSSLQAAKDEVMKKTGITRFFNEETGFYVPGKVPHIDGDPYFIFSGTQQPVKSGGTELKEPAGDPSGGRGIEQLGPKKVPGFDLGGRGIVPPALRKSAPGTPPKGTGGFASPEPDSPRSCEDPNYSGDKKPIPAAAALEVMGIRAPDPGDEGASETCIKGYLNLITRKMESWSDAVRNY